MIFRCFQIPWVTRTSERIPDFTQSNRCIPPGLFPNVKWHFWIIEGIFWKWRSYRFVAWWRTAGCRHTECRDIDWISNQFVFAILVQCQILTAKRPSSAGGIVNTCRGKSSKSILKTILSTNFEQSMSQIKNKNTSADLKDSGNLNHNGAGERDRMARMWILRPDRPSHTVW